MRLAAKPAFGDLPGQSARLPRLPGIAVPKDPCGEIAEARTLATMRKLVESSERRFLADTPFRDPTDFHGPGTSANGSAG